MREKHWRKWQNGEEKGKIGVLFRTRSGGKERGDMDEMK